MSHDAVCRYHYRGISKAWLTTVTVWLFFREGMAKNPCKCGSWDGIYIQSRHYERTMNTSVALRNGLISLLDQTFPGANSLFGSEVRTVSGHIKWVDFVSKRSIITRQ